MKKVFSLIIFGLLTTTGAVFAMDSDGTEYDGTSPIIKKALRKAKHNREILDAELKQLDRDPSRDTPCPWEKDKATHPEGIAAPAPLPAKPQTPRENSKPE